MSLTTKLQYRNHNAGSFTSYEIYSSSSTLDISQGSVARYTRRYDYFGGCAMRAVLEKRTCGTDAARRDIFCGRGTRRTLTEGRRCAVSSSHSPADFASRFTEASRAM